MAATADLATAVDSVHSPAAGSVRLVGDDQQLAAIAAGGVLRDIASHRRRRHPLRAAAVHRPRRRRRHPRPPRRRHRPALGFYLDHGRVHVGDLTTVTDQAYTAWAADRAAGLDAVMLAPTRDLVAELNARARTDRLAASTDAAVRRSAEHAVAGRSTWPTGPRPPPAT